MRGQSNIDDDSKSAVNFAKSITFNNLDVEVIEIGKRALIDYVGVALAG